MAALRFLAALCALVAILALVSDATPSLSGKAPFDATSLEAHWQSISPSTLKSAQGSLSKSVSPTAWNVLKWLALDRPTFVLFGLLAAILGYAGRRRRRIDIYVN